MEYIKCQKGQYILIRNYRDAFNLDNFMDKYLEEYYNKYPYIVGDISSSILRLKGFDDKPGSPNNYERIDEYLDTSCAFGCPFYVLKRIGSFDDFSKYKASHKEIVEVERVKIKFNEKENFDKENLVLETSVKNKPNIVIDSDKISKLPKGSLPLDLLDSGSNNNSNNKEVKAKEVEVETTTYVSSSPDFDPSLKKENKNNNFFNKNRKNRDKKNARK